MTDGEDIHIDNPGEELNFFGYLNGTESPNQGSNFGYPYCFASWFPEDLPNQENFTIGSQFALDSSNDTLCTNATSPRLTLFPHSVRFHVRGC